MMTFSLQIDLQFKTLKNKKNPHHYSPLFPTGELPIYSFFIESQEIFAFGHILDHLKHQDDAHRKYLSNQLFFHLFLMWIRQRKVGDFGGKEMRGTLVGSLWCPVVAFTT